MMYDSLELLLFVTDVLLVMSCMYYGSTDQLSHCVSRVSQCNCKPDNSVVAVSVVAAAATAAAGVVLQENHSIILRMLAACLVGGEDQPLPDPVPSLQRATSTAGVAFYDPVGASAAEPCDADSQTGSGDSVAGLDDDVLDAIDVSRQMSSESRKALLQELDASDTASAPDDSR